MAEKSTHGNEQTNRSVYYLFASPSAAPDQSSASVFYRVEGEQLAQSLSTLFTKEYGGAGGESAFHHVAAASLSAPDQVLLDEALQWLDVYSDPDPGVYDPEPTKDIITRAQYTMRAKTWEELLRTKAESTVSPNVGQLPSGNGETLPPSTDKVPEMPAEDWRNAGLTLLMLLAQAYYKLLESAVGVPCGAVDLDLNHSYLWTLKNIRNLLENHPDLADFPIPFEPVFPDLYPSTVRDVDWEDMIAPDAERFLSTVQGYVMNKGIYSPEERSPAWIFIEMFKPGINSAIQSGVAYRKRMNQHFQKLIDHTAKTVAARTAAAPTPAPVPQGQGTQAIKPPSSPSPVFTDAPSAQPVPHTEPVKKKWPDPTIDTVAMVWTTKNGSFWIRTKKGERKEGKAEFPMGSDGNPSKQSQLLRLLAFKYPTPMPVSEVMEQVYPEDTAAARVGKALLAPLLKKCRTLFSDLRDKLEKSDINPRIIPSLSVDTDKSTEVVLQVTSVRNMDDHCLDDIDNPGAGNR